MANYLNIEPCLPFRFVYTGNPGIHFDQSWFCEQIKEWERKVYYKQKWIRSKKTKLQIETTILPQNLRVYDINGDVVKSIAWTTVVDSTSYKICEVEFDMSDKPEGTYYVFIQVTGGPLDWTAISEPIHIKDTHKNLIHINYKNSYNVQGITFSTGVDFTFAIEAAIMEMTPEADRTAYVNQNRDVFNIYGTPWRSFKLMVGDAKGVPRYMVDILNRIFCMDTISIEGKKYVRAEGAKVEMSGAKGYPMVGAQLEIVEAVNAGGVRYNDGSAPLDGLVHIYDMDTDFFGTDGSAKIIDAKEI